MIIFTTRFISFLLTDSSSYVLLTGYVIPTALTTTTLIVFSKSHSCMRRHLVLLTLVLCGLLAVGSFGAVGQSPADFSIESASTVTIPAETVSNDFTDGELTVDKTAVIGPNETLTGTATVPNPTEQTYFFQFRDADQRVIDDTATDGTETTYEFAAGPESPGSYALNIWDPGEQLVKAVLPVVIESHEVSAVTVNGSAPATADVAPNEAAPVDVSLTTLEATPIDAVNVTVWNDTTQHSATLRESSSGEYTGELPALEEGEYHIQIRVRGGETVNGRPSLIGLSEASSLTVADTGGSGDNDDDTNGGSSDEPDGGTDSDGSTDDDSSSDDTTNGSDTTNGTSSDGADGDTTTNGTADSGGDDDSVTNGTDTDSETGTNTSDDSSDTTDEPTEPNESDSSTNDTNGTIDPNDGTGSSDETADSTPLYVIQPILLTVFFGGLLRRLKRSQR